MAKRNLPSAVKVLYDGDDYVRLTELARALASARAQRDASRNNARSGDTFGVDEAQAAYDDFEAEAAGRAVEVRLRALAPSAWKALVDAHKGNDEDEVHEAYGFDPAAMRDPLIEASIESPAAGTEDRADLVLTDGESDELFQLAYQLNRGGAADPKALRSASSLSSTATGE